MDTGFARKSYDAISSTLVAFDSDRQNKLGSGLRTLTNALDETGALGNRDVEVTLAWRIAYVRNN